VLGANVQNTHRLLAWGVLGFATGGLLFSLLTLFAFRRNDSENPSLPVKFRNSLIFLDFSNSLAASKLSGVKRVPVTA
jgi:hypothetical protein